jgi:shikimate kinase
MLRAMRRIIVIGCPGSGKTRFALNLGRKLGLPVGDGGAHVGIAERPIEDGLAALFEQPAGGDPRA